MALVISGLMNKQIARELRIINMASKLRSMSSPDF
jgi:hypothetical protein